MNKSLLSRIANEYGTPVYVYNLEKIKDQYLKLSTSFSETNARFFYSCKALSNINILKHICSLGAGLDAVSLNEIQLGLKAGFNPSQIIYTPNCVDFEEIEAAKDLGVHITIDNISILEQFGNKYGGTYPIIIRINPHIMAGGTYKISTGHIDSKFGISIHQLRHIERIVNTTGLSVEGLHMHTGSDIKDIDVFIEGLELILDVSTHFKDIKYIDVGSGFKVAYHKEDIETDVSLLGSKIKTALNHFCTDTKKNIEIWFEPGKFLVSESGTFIVKANVIKQTPATVFVGVNSGFNHLIRPMFYDAYHQIENISNPDGIERIYTVVGNLCETDTFCWDRKLNEVREGDFLAFKNAGAYGFEMSSNFNARNKPAEVSINGNEIKLIRKATTFDDLFLNQIIE